MAIIYGDTFTAAKSGTLPQAQPAAGLCGGKRRSHTESLTMAAQASGSQLYLGTLPIGAIFEGVEINASATLGSATLAIGTLASTGKYAAAATFTTPDTPTVRAIATAQAQGALSAPEDVYATVAAAALPGAGKLVITLRYKTAA